jgi:hypothetical protein
MRVCIFKVRRRLLAGCCIVYLNFGKFGTEYTMRVCIFERRFFVFLSPKNLRISKKIATFVS